MLIMKSGLMARPLASGPNFEKLLSNQNAAATDRLKGQGDGVRNQQAAQAIAQQMKASMVDQASEGQWPPPSKWHMMQLEEDI